MRDFLTEHGFLTKHGRAKAGLASITSRSSGDIVADNSTRPDLQRDTEILVLISIEGMRVLVRDLEALNGTPIVDVKPVLNRSDG